MRSNYRYGLQDFTWLAAIVLHLLILLVLNITESQANKQNQTSSTNKKNNQAQERRQLVTIVPVKPQTKPKEAKFLADFDQETDHEQVADKTSLNQEIISPEPSTVTVGKTTGQETENNLTIDDYLETNNQLAKPAPQDPLGLMGNIPGSGDHLAMPYGDHVDDVTKGNKTELNTWQWRHAPFFNRIKTRVGQVWAPARQIARYDPTAALIGQKNRVTVLKISIDRDGYLTHAEVRTSSGVAYLDEEAERAFRQAAPFPYPPKELFNNGDLFTFDFGFHLEIDKGISFDFEWNPS